MSRPSPFQSPATGSVLPSGRGRSANAGSADPPSIRSSVAGPGPPVQAQGVGAAAHLARRPAADEPERVHRARLIARQLATPVDLEVDVRRRRPRVAGVAHPADQLAPPHPLPGGHVVRRVVGVAVGHARVAHAARCSGPPLLSSVPSTLAMTPDSTATIGVPSGAKMSLPLCWRRQPSRQACQSSENDTSYGAGTGNELIGGTTAASGRGSGSGGAALAGEGSSDAPRPARTRAVANARAVTLDANCTPSRLGNGTHR